MTSSEPALWPAVELAAALRRRELGCRELLDFYLDRIERHDSRLGAVVTLAADEARKGADEADAALRRGEPRGPLHGLPMTVKDQFETAGIRTTCGAEIWAEHVPDRDAEAVARLKRAGAIVFGKSNTAAFAGDWQTSNSLFGTTRNPWDPARTPGGSSGGAAAGVAAGLTALELGGDIGGSVRIPAAFCGVYGHKPTYGLVPGRGTLPARPGSLSATDVASAGPLGRSADDLELALDVLAGPDDLRAVAWQLELPAPRRASTAEYRIAVWSDDDGFPVAAEVRDAVETAASALERAGAHVDRTARPGFELAETVDLRQQLVYPILARGLSDEEFAAELERAGTFAPDDPSPAARRARFATQTHRDWFGVDERRERLRATFAAFFRRFDVLLCPVCPVVAFPHDERPQDERTILVDGRERPYSHLGSWISPAGVAYLPATAAPVGRTRAGLPVGVQIVGPYLEDRTPIDVARRLAELLGGYEPPPGYGATVG